MEKRDILERLGALCNGAQKVAVATIVRTYGSTPREVGAKMIILEDGTTIGTVGGGCGEAEVWQEAQEVLAGGVASQVTVNLTEDPEAGGEKICGGTMDVFVDLWAPHDLRAAAQATTLIDHGTALSLATVMSAPAGCTAPPGARIFLGADGWSHGTMTDARLDARIRSTLTDLMRGGRSCIAALSLHDSSAVVPAPRRPSPEQMTVFVEVLDRPPLLLIAGAGHCALPLSRMARMLGFKVVILDDRPECATGQRFPDASQILVGNLASEVRRVPLDRNTAVVLVTRGHRQDEEILREIVREPLGYIGMIGSRRRISAVFADMERDGFESCHLDRVYSPIGLDIGAESPEEIAISILAEIIRIRRGGTGQSMALRARH